MVFLGDRVARVLYPCAWVGEVTTVVEEKIEM